MKYPSIFATLLLTICCERASAQVFFYNDPAVSTTGTIVFNDILSGGVSTTAFSPVIPFGYQPMPNLGWMTYASTGAPHVDSASMNLDIDQVPGGPGSIPWFAATATLSQAASVNGDTALLTGTVQTGFEGFMNGVNPSALLGLLGYSVSGILGTNTGAFATLNAQLDYYVTGGPLIGSLIWNQTFTGAGPYSGTVIPTWSGGPLTSNLITVNGFIQLQADPSSISIAPVPEPTAGVSLFLGAAALGVRRRRAK